MEVFKESELAETGNFLNRIILNNSLSKKEKANIENFLNIIRFLQMELDAYQKYATLKIYPGKKEKELFKEIIAKMQYTICLTPQSVYFNTEKTPSLLLRKYTRKRN